eukprot:TRINITY_DN1504_c0_g1_i2.p1 TRINITY_DN1504_c0_g1~~TRINITY_DN1504_c0_g1_i2.p1  ORF type:complete len:297 (-),score=71.04 TRINITY_DN1504_c0_g1_i2:166-1056(-)
MWGEHFGQINIKNLKNSSSSYKAVVNFKKSGFFQGPQYKVEGYVLDKDDNKCIKVEGRWDEYLDATWLIDIEHFKKGETHRLWQISPYAFVPNCSYKLTHFATSLNDFPEDMQSILPTTDSRRRLDRLFLDYGETDSATHWKHAMEEKQRKKKRGGGNSSANLETSWSPVWFKPITVDTDDERLTDKKIWVYCGDYWEQRQRRIELIKEGKDPGDVLRPSCVKGMACDFTSYDVPVLRRKRRGVETPSTTNSEETKSEGEKPAEEEDDQKVSIEEEVEDTKNTTTTTTDDNIVVVL